MPDRRRTDEELEALLRAQPRRMPSERLWQRLATQPAPRRAWSLAWAGGLAAAAGILVLALTLRTAPPTLVVRQSPPPARPKVIAQSKAAPIQYPTSKLVLPPPRARQLDRVQPALRHSYMRAKPTLATHRKPPAPSVLPSVGDASRYYLEVSRDGDRSVLSGSVTRDSSNQVTNISIVYEPAERASTKSVY